MDDCEMRERGRYVADLERVAGLPLVDRQENRETFRRDCETSPALVCERIGWLLNGSYGYGSHAAARQVLGSRMNKRAWLFVTIAALEWQVPNGFARQVWNGLSAEAQRAINSGIDAEMADAVEA